RNLALSQEALVESVPWAHLAEQLPKEIPDHIADEFLAIAPYFKGLCNSQKEPHSRFIEQIDLLIAGNPEILLEDDLFLEYIDSHYLKKNKE
ncbi:hypothetical protein GN156_28080, partial [bacterium LRH843]|nr:hypothetical protein [bacterium LRH843]